MDFKKTRPEVEANDGLRFETPPQNKENIVDEDNDVVSAKKSLTVEKKYYKLRPTPMRALQYNGSTPLRETRISSIKKKRYRQLAPEVTLTVRVNNESESLTKEDIVFNMDQLIEALPEEEVIVSNSLQTMSTNETNCQYNEENIRPKDQIQNESQVSGEVDFEVMDQKQELIEDKDNKEQENVIQVQTEVENQTVVQVLNEGLNEEEIEIFDPKTVKVVSVVSPTKSLNRSANSMKKRFNSQRKRTPNRKSIVNSNRKVSAQSVVSRLYSSAKKSENKFEFKSMAEMLKEFETQPRSCERSRSVERNGSGMRSRSSSVSSITNLTAGISHCPTPRQTEGIIASEIKRYTFKANPIRKKLFDPKYASGIPRVKTTKGPTKAIEMNFMTKKRNELRSNKEKNEETDEEVPKPFKANPMPAFRNPRALQSTSEKKCTTFKPFSFDERIKVVVDKRRHLSVDSDNGVNNEDKKSFRF